MSSDTGGRASREAARDAGLGYQRWRRYSDAFDRIEQCIRQGYYLEAVALLDSLITDRLASRIGHINRAEPVMNAIGPLCKVLLGNPKASDSAGIERDRDFRSVVEEIKVWADRRNNAMHAVAKILRSDDSESSFGQAVDLHYQTAVDGVSLLRRFDLLDTADRARVGKIPASAPNAFFPERRERKLSGAPDRARLRALLARAVREMYSSDRALIDSEVREEALVFRIGCRLANWVEHSGGEVRVDLEYNRGHTDDGTSSPKRGDDDKLVIPDLVVHSRGGNTQNLLIVEARRAIPANQPARQRELNKLISRLEMFRDKYGYEDAAFLLLAGEPRWWRLDDNRGLVELPHEAN